MYYRQFAPFPNARPILPSNKNSTKPIISTLALSALCYRVPPELPVETSTAHP